MKHLNFLSKSSSRSMGHSSMTLALTVGSPSAHRRGTMLKHVAFLLLFLFAGFGNVWGATYTYNFTQGASTNYWTSNNNSTGVGTDNIASFYYMQSGYSGHQFTAGNGSSNTHNHKFVTGTNACFFLGKTGEYLVLPTYTNEIITNVNVALRSGYGSSDVGINIYAGSTAASDASTSVGSGHDFAIKSSYQSSQLKVQITNSKNAAITQIVITTSSSCNKSVTVTTPSATHGTISGATTVATCSSTASDRQVTLMVTPSSGYGVPTDLTLGGTITPTKVSGPTSNGAGAYTYVYQFAQNASGSTSFSATCPELQKYKVTFSTGAGNSTVNAITEASVGSGITLPSGPSTIKCASDGWEFAGWSETEITSESSSATLLPAGNYKPASDVTLYAVYRKGSVAANATTVTYTLTGNWTTNNGNWTVISGALDGTLANNKYGIGQNSTYQTTTASSPVSITDISSITFSGTKSNTGAGTVAFYYGSGNSWTLIESKNFGTSLTWSPNPNVTGYLKCVFTRTAGNIYMASIGVTGKFPSYTYISSPDCCTELGHINGSFFWTTHFYPVWSEKHIS